MRIQLTGKHLDVSDALSSHVETELVAAINKYADRPVEAVITFSKDRHEFVSESKVHLSTGMTVQAKGRATDVYASFDSCLERMEKQLRRYKRRLKNHHSDRNGAEVEAFDAPYQVLASAPEDDEPESLQPIVVAETTTPIQSLSVGEAVMQMELAASSMLVFRNDGHGGVNVVYRRDDGNIGWIDPRNLPTT